MLRSLKPLELDVFDEMELEATLIAMIRHSSRPLARRSSNRSFIKWFINL